MAVAAPPFQGFRPEAIEFLAELAENNDRARFQPRKADHDNPRTSRSQEQWTWL